MWYPQIINPNIHQISGAEKPVAMSETAGGTERRNVGGWVEQPTAPWVVSRRKGLGADVGALSRLSTEQLWIVKKRGLTN